MIILLDMDGPLADFEGGFLTKWKEKHPELSYIEKHDRNTFDVKKQYPTEYVKFVREIYTSHGFIENLPVIPGSIDFIRDVIELGHEVFICSTPTSTYDPNVIEKYRWVENNLGKDFINRLILTRDKTLIRGDVLIDDNLEIKGKLSPVWKHVVFNAPYNTNVGEPFRIKEDWSNWKEILLK